MWQITKDNGGTQPARGRRREEAGWARPAGRPRPKGVVGWARWPTGPGTPPRWK
jgi:hypothetical protein